MTEKYGRLDTKVSMEEGKKMKRDTYQHLIDDVHRLANKYNLYFTVGINPEEIKENKQENNKESNI